MHKKKHTPHHQKTTRVSSFSSHILNNINVNCISISFALILQKKDEEEHLLVISLFIHFIQGAVITFFFQFS